MFAYCSNNPVNYCDPAGTLWKGISNLLDEIWEGIRACFGGEVSTVATVDYGEKIIPEPSPIVVEVGTKTSKTITKKGDSSKPYSVYAEIDSLSPLRSSTVGAKINYYNFTLDSSLGLDKTGTFYSFADSKREYSLGVVANISEFKIGLEFSTTTHTQGVSNTNYANISVSGWAILVAYALLTTGQNVMQPTYA